MSSFDDLPRIIARVEELIARQKLVENVVHAQHSDKQSLVENLVQRQHVSQLRDYLQPLHSADLARLLEAIPREQRIAVWNSLEDLKAADVLLDVSPPVRENLLQETPESKILQLLREMDPDDISYISATLPEQVLHQHRNLADSEGLQQLRSSMSYADNQVGRRMSRDFVVLRQDTPLKTARRYLRRLRQLPAGTNQVFVVDERQVLCGSLSLEKLLMGDSDQLVGEVMASKLVRFSDTDSLSDAAQAFERYDLLSAPVVNSRHKLVGRLTIDEMVDVIRHEAQEDTLNIAGVRQQEDLFSPIWDSARNRWPWLALNLATVFIASRVIGLFEQTISQLVALAVLMPIVGAMAGNTGNQTTALVIRGLAIQQIHPGNQWHLMRKELSISLLNGLVWGSVVALFTYLLYRDLALSLVIDAAVIINLFLAALAGVGLPLLLTALGRDPAMGASILITATTDSLGFFIFLGLASIILV
jgi:magnesium transporter